MDIGTTTQVLLGAVPPTHPERACFEASIDAILRSAAFTAPEAMPVRWRELHALLRATGDPELQATLVALYRGQ